VWPNAVIESDEAGFECFAPETTRQNVTALIDGLVDESSLHFACGQVDRAKDGLPCHGRGAPTAGMDSQAQRSIRG
jgi:hypothetical protein